ncbi:MAG TPA: winged helix-turn-helix domain-containing protein [Thermoplasmata archaeon]|nr:winged helix-turn-helix domain-containing protein [Thermoplasmata archaeon]
MAAPLQRPDLYVVVRILEALARHERRLKRTNLQVASGVNYTQFVRYLDFLAERGLVAAVPGENGSATVELTARGYDAMMFIARSIREYLGDVTRGPIGG